MSNNSPPPSLAEAARAVEQCAKELIENVSKVPFTDPAHYRLDKLPLWKKFVGSIDALGAALEAQPELCPGDQRPCYIDSGNDHDDEAHWRCGTAQCGKPPSVAGGAAPTEEKHHAVVEAAIRFCMLNGNKKQQARQDLADAVLPETSAVLPPIRY